MVCNVYIYIINARRRFYRVYGIRYVCVSTLTVFGRYSSGANQYGAVFPMGGADPY